MMNILLGVVAIVSVIISYSAYSLSKKKMEQFENNCIATLSSKMLGLEKQMGSFREDLKEIYEEIDKVNKNFENRVSYLEGKFNGKR